MIDIKDLQFSYVKGFQPVFDHFSTSMERGHVYGLLGKNGTGKSTLLYLIAGLLRPKSGSVTVDGQSDIPRSPELLTNMFLVPEEFDLPGVMLEEYVKLNAPFYPHFSHDTLAHCLDIFELSGDIHLRHLSMGQKKKVFISFALATETRLLLMDEPTNGLDIPSKSQFRRAVAESMTDDRTLIISTHQVHDVEQLFDHVLIISNQGMLLDAPMSQISERFAFSIRQPQDMDSDVIYAEPTLAGNLALSRRQEGQPETPVSLELLFNAVNQGLVK